MHNRLRMVVGSFLVKNLLIDWREGEKWFWDCLVDADLPAIVQVGNGLLVQAQMQPLFKFLIP